jgi:hypothetical protein
VEPEVEAVVAAATEAVAAWQAQARVSTPDSQAQHRHAMRSLAEALAALEEGEGGE